ncbi:hypothetical protein DFH09DRAFT_1342183 [Mycena vulgaris]|nr:hypothetical protein DFH09DRAFT_1342183 [Mycena vulgaris]
MLTLAFCSARTAIRLGSARRELHASWARLVSLGFWDGGRSIYVQGSSPVEPPTRANVYGAGSRGLGTRGRGWSSGTRARAVELADAEGLGTALREEGRGDGAGLLSKEA